MPIHGYPGNIITANPTEPSQTSASGVWTTEQQLQYQNAGKWPPPYYLISRSLRFNYADSAYLSRGMSTANTTTWTVSFWFKTGLNQSIGSGYGTILSVFESVETTGAGRQLGISQTNAGTFQLSFYKYAPSTYTMRKIPAMVFRDPSAWYHAVFVWNTTSAVAEDRAQIWINGVRVTAWATNINPAQNEAWLWSMFTNQFIGPQNRDNGSVIYPWDGYLTEVNFIDGQALTPSSFGETDSATGVWKPKAYSGTYGTNGFYLKFADNSGTTSTTLGKDSSGNGNNWTPNNFSVTAGAGNDSLTDTPTSYGTDTGAGGEVRGNYCTMNPLTVPTLPTINNGNLDVAATSGVRIAQGTFWFPSSGKWYYECTFNNASSGVNGMFIGITSPTRGANVVRSTAGAYFFYASSSGLLNSNGTDIVTGLSAISANEIFKVAVDIDNSKVWIGRGSTWYNSSGGTTGDPAAGTNPTFSISATGLTPMAGFDASSVSLSMNFGQRTWAQTCPSGFKALCTQNLPTPTIGATSTTTANKYFDATTYTGNGGTQSITNSGSMQPDLVWVKTRSATSYHQLIDSVRGVSTVLNSNYTGAESSYPGYSVTAFNSNGFTVVDDAAASYGVNGSTGSPTYVGWQWNAGGSNATNTSGTITSTVSANTTSGFSIVTYTGIRTSAGNDTIGHGLGIAPAMVISKSRNTSTVWIAQHSSLGTDQYLELSTTSAARNSLSLGAGALPKPTSTVFYGSWLNGLNVSGQTQVAYCFAPVAGYSAFGSFTGNGSADGPFVYLGFRPAFVMAKLSSATGDWNMVDDMRQTYNDASGNPVLRANLSSAEEDVDTMQGQMDLLSNGFKLRSNNSSLNLNGGTIIYAAFAENPFKYALAR